MFINTDRFQEEYSMNLKRIVSLILALMLAVNTPAALAADAHAGAADGLLSAARKSYLTRRLALLTALFRLGIWKT